MKYDPELDVAPPVLGSWWTDRVTGRLVEVVAYRKLQGRVTSIVFLHHQGVSGEWPVTHEAFRAEYVPADPP